MTDTDTGSGAAPAPMGRRERKKAATRQAIADAALRLFLERGYDDVGIREIAEAADVSTTTLFKHFPVKEALVFDEDAENEARLLAAVRERPAGQSIPRPCVSTRCVTASPQPAATPASPPSPTSSTAPLPCATTCRPCGCATPMPWPGPSPRRAARPTMTRRALPLLTSLSKPHAPPAATAIPTRPSLAPSTSSKTGGAPSPLKGDHHGHRERDSAGHGARARAVPRPGPTSKAGAFSPRPAPGWPCVHAGQHGGGPAPQRQMTARWGTSQ